MADPYEPFRDKDNLRIDILKVRQKVFSQYPLGSDEHKSFLKSIKAAELGHLTTKVPPALVDFVLEASKYIIKHEVKEILKWTIPLLLVIAANMLVNTTLEHVLLFAIALFFGYHSGKHLGHLYSQLRDLKAMRENYDKLKHHMNKLSSDLKKLEGPGEHEPPH